MKISKTKYFKVIGKIHASSLPSVLKEAHGVIMSKTNFGEDWSLYNKDAELTRLINLVYTKAEELIKSNRTYLTPKDAAMHLLKDSVVSGAEPDELINKKLSVKNTEYAAHVEGEKVHVTMLYGTDINERFYIEDLVPDILNTYLSEADRKRLSKTRRTFNHKQPEFKIFKAVLAWEERLVTRSMVTSLLQLIADGKKEKTLKSQSPVAKEIDLVEAKLKAVLKVMTDSITIRFSPETKKGWRVALKKVTDANKNNKGSKGGTLSGISTSVSQVALASKTGIISSEDFARTEFKTIGLQGKWLMLIGDPCPGFKAAVSGMPKMGKSFLCVEFANYLASNHGKVIYITKEEFMSPTFQIKIREKSAASPNLDIAGEVPSDLSAYQYIFIDSVTSLKLTPDDLKKLEEKCPGKSFIYVHQVTKAGKARGTNEYLHNVDIIIELPERGKAIQYGRYNQGGEMDIFSAESEKKSQDNLELSENTSTLSGINNHKEMNENNVPEQLISIEAEIAVPYEVISMALFADEQNDENMERFEEEQPERLDQTIQEICEDELSGSGIKVEAIRRVTVKDNMDGFFFCKVSLKGTESELRERVGEDEIFMYDWSKFEQGMTNSYFKKLQLKKQ